MRCFRVRDSPHGRGVLAGAKVGNGVAVGAGVGVATGFGVAICACAPAKKATRPTRMHTLRIAIPTVVACVRLNVGVERICFSSLKFQPNNSFEASVLVLFDVTEFSTNADHLRNSTTTPNSLAIVPLFDGHFRL